MESFNGKLRDELLNLEAIYTLLEVQVLTEQYRQTYTRIRPHSSLGYQPPAPEAKLSAEPVPVLVGLHRKWYNSGVGHGQMLAFASMTPSLRKCTLCGPTERECARLWISSRKPCLGRRTGLSCYLVGPKSTLWQLPVVSDAPCLGITGRTPMCGTLLEGCGHQMGADLPFQLRYQKGMRPTSSQLKWLQMDQTPTC